MVTEPVSVPSRLREIVGDATGAGVRVAVIDSGWDHELLIPGLQIDPGFSLTTDTAGLDSGSPTADLIGHGTACITTIHRLAPSARIAPIRVFGTWLTASLATVTAAIERAADEGFDIINLSLSLTDAAASANDVHRLYHACASAAARGTIIVAATDGPDALPAAFATVVSVGAGTQRDPFAFTYHPNARVECVAACGIDGTVLWRRGALVPANQPSYAAPNITGILALVRQAQPGIDITGIRALLPRLASDVIGDA